MTLAQVFSCEFCEVSENTFSNRTPLVAASVNCFEDIAIDLISFALRKYGMISISILIHFCLIHFIWNICNVYY